IKINALFSAVQQSLSTLSNPQLFNAVSATESNPSFLTGTANPSVTATPGTYTILATHLATASSVTSSSTYGHSENDLIGGNPARSIVLNATYTQITPSNGDPSKGGASVTVDGVKIGYDVTSQSLDFILNNITNQVRTVTGDSTFLATTAAGSDTVVFSSTAKPITLGSATDNGNILQVFKLDQAQLVNGASSGLITAVAGVGGVNQVQLLDSVNKFGATTDAGYVTAVTSGTFTVNGVTIAVDNTKDALSDVLKRINASGAGVTATFDQETGKISITNNGTGPQSIVLGSGSDTSNFLSASGLTGAGSTSTVGQQAFVTVQNPGGSTSTIYSNSNTISTAVPGINLNLLQTTATQSTLTVAADSSGLVSAVNGFITTYNAAINEINTATVAPTVVAAKPGSLSSQAQSVGGGVLYGNADVAGIKDALTTIVAGIGGGTNGYNSLSTIGLQINSSFTVLAPSGGAANASGPVTTQTLGGTDGALAPLDVAKFQAALTANRTQVQTLFTAPTGVIANLGTYLTGLTGQPTLLSFGLVGKIPNTSVLQGFENANSDEITSLQQQVKQVTDSANSYADSLRREFQNTEKQMAGFQALQSQLAGFFKNG
ncbi:MAG: flagellar filament capping protein FliD, partial [Candidatus Baltobacteraceae bacterium]